MAWNELTPRIAETARGRAVRCAPVVATLALVLAAAALSGCSVVLPRESPINDLTKDAPSALQIYRAHAGGSPGAGASAGVGGVTGGPIGPSIGGSRGANERNVRDEFERDAVERTGGLRKVANTDGEPAPTGRYWSALEPMRQRFAKVPNPDLVMVVYPHLAQGRYPVPGYVTTFQMYEETNYALPGEIQDEYRRSRERFTPTLPSTAARDGDLAGNLMLSPPAGILPPDAAADEPATTVRSARR